ncbi:MAG: cytochrome P450 [Deltaproteobacteria bacterium]|nr:cytochrome P450 [Deltaproteobacteria bacterium]MBW2421000.1 cytochrome P450 [Deltaproteobacteria bacterium]
MAADLVYDPYDYEIDADPHPVWKRMRDEAPLYYNAEHDFYALSRFEDVLAASVDHETYCSNRGTVLELMDAPMQDPPMIFMDPPRHTHFRKLVRKTFTKQQIGKLEGRIRELCRGYLEPFVGAGGFDYVEDFGAKLPVMVISSLLGAPEEDQEQLRIWSDLTLHREPGETGPSAAARAATSEMWSYWQGQIKERRARPRDDVMSQLIQAELELEDGGTRRLSDGELYAFYLLISSAGNETVARFLGNTATLLAWHPAERAKLVADPGLIPNAVEEILRFESPSPIQARWVTRDVEIHGQVVPGDSKMALLTSSANRDEREFPDADRFDVARKIDRHVALGFGIHFCLGASLARLETRVSIDETLRLFPTWEVDEAGLRRVHTSTVRGYNKVPITC